MIDIVIFGSGGLAREVHQIIEDINDDNAVPNEGFNFLGFLDGLEENQGKEVHGYEILGDVEWLQQNDNVSVVVAIGSPIVRKRIVDEINSKIDNPKFEKLIHPRAWIGNRNSLGMGTIICADTLITTDVVIGEHVILNIDCTVGHDTIIDDFCTASPSTNISGNIHVQEGCDIGTSSTIIEKINIGHWSIIGAGSVVIKDIIKNSTSVGSPSKVIKEREDGWQLT